VVYDNQTRSMLQTDQRLPVANPDTSVDVYFGPTAPAGHEANWVQTIPGKRVGLLDRRRPKMNRTGDGNGHCLLES
jgi:hypothetical protein